MSVRVSRQKRDVPALSADRSRTYLQLKILILDSSTELVEVQILLFPVVKFTRIDRTLSKCTTGYYKKDIELV